MPHAPTTQDSKDSRPKPSDGMIGEILDFTARLKVVRPLL
jgi:hypothetical protein